MMKPRTIIGILLIVAGAWKLANLWGFIENDWLWRQPWTIYIAPIALIYIVHYGGDEYVYRGEVFHGARLDAFCGGIRMDLRNATITEDEEIEIHTFCGGVELIVPQTVNVEVKSRSFIGGVGNHATHIIGKDGPCLHVIADNFLGGVDIKN